MGYLTESRLENIIEIPISLAATSLNMGDWLVIGSVKILQPMRLSCRLLDLQVLTSTVTVSDLDPTNLIFGNLGIVYVVLRKDYATGSPGDSNGVDTVVAFKVGRYSRDTTTPVVVSDPGVYTWLIANNTKPSTVESPAIAAGTAINFEVSVTGSARLELDFA